MTVSSSQTEVSPDTHSNTAQVTGPITQAFVDLWASMDPPAATAVVGQALQFSAIARNYGPATATNLTLTFNVPANYAIDTAQMTSQGCTVAGGTVTCVRGTWAPSTYLSALYVLHVTPVAPGTAVTVTVTASADQAEVSPQVYSNTASASMNITGVASADMEAQLSAAATSVEVGQATTLSAMAYNHGPANATNVTLAINVPSNYAIDSAMMTPQGCVVAGQVVTCNMGGVSVNGGVGPTLFVTPTAVGTGSLFTLSVSSDQPEPSGGGQPNTAQVTQDVTAVPDLSGLVTKPGGQAVGGAVVSLFAPGDVWVPSQQATTTSTGYFSFGTVTPGTYRLAIAPSAGSGVAPATQTITVTASGPADGSIQLLASAAVSGHIYAGGLLLAGATATLYRVGAYVPFGSMTTDGSGYFEFADLAAGSYRVVVQPPSGSGLAARSVTVQMNDGQSLSGTDVEFPAQGSVAGVVQASGGTAVAGARVAAYKPTDGYVGTAATVTAADGTFSLVGLAPGTYYLMITPPTGSGLHQFWYGDVTLRSAATPLTVNDGTALTGLTATFAP